MNSIFTDNLERRGQDFIAVASDESMDRTGESIPVESWDLTDYEKNPILLFAHDYKIPPIGIAKKIWIDTKERALKFIPEFQTITKFGRDIKRLFEQGFLKTFSVGFLPVYDDESELVANQLLEISAVPVPANPNAVMQVDKFLNTFGFERVIPFENWLVDAQETNDSLSKIAKAVIISQREGRVLKFEKQENSAFERMQLSYSDLLLSQGRVDEWTELQNRLPKRKLDLSLEGQLKRMHAAYLDHLFLNDPDSYAEQKIRDQRDEYLN